MQYCTLPLWCPSVTFPTPRNEGVCGGFHMYFAFLMLSAITNKEILKNGVITSSSKLPTLQAVLSPLED